VDGVRPLWTGQGFRVAGESVPVLDYDAGDSGWDESLTDLHEEVAEGGQHPIDVASRRRARAMLKKYLRTPAADAVLLEAGCSSGYLLEELLEDWPESLVVGSDFIKGPLHRLAARRPTLPLLRFDLVKCPLPSASLDAVILLNVLEHIEDDRAAVAQVRRLLKPGGLAVIEVPAGPELYDAYDKHLQHFRRYRLNELCRLIEAEGLRILDRSHIGCFVYPAFALTKRRNQRVLDAAPEVQQALVEQNIRSSGSRLLGLVMAAERWAGHWIRYPVGIRCVVVAQAARGG